MLSNLASPKQTALFFCALSLLFLFRLGSNDFAEWDEAYYASRAAVVVTQNEWIDQSSLAVGGLWTGAHPPLVIWAMSFLGKILGPNEWAFRLPSAICGLATVWVLFALVRHLSKDTALSFLAAGLLVLTPLFIRLSRVAQLDVPVLLFVILSIFWFWLGWNGKKQFVILAGVAFGCSLMSKIAVGFFSVLILGFFLSWEFARGERKEALWGLFQLTVMGLVGIIVAVPWHVVITNKLGMDYWETAYGYHVFSRIAKPIEGSESGLGIIFWPHEALVKLGGLFPFAILGMLSHSGSLPGSKERRFLWSSFLIPFLIFSLTASKKHNYLLLFLIPLVIFSAIGVKETFFGAKSGRYLRLMLPMSIAALAWSQTHPLQRALTRIVESLSAVALPQISDIVSVTAFVGVTVAAAWSFNRFALPTEVDGSGRRVRVLYGIGFLLPLVLVGLGPLFVSKTDWNETITFLNQEKPKSLLFYGGDKATAQFYLKYSFQQQLPNETIGTGEINAEGMAHKFSKLQKGDFLIMQKGVMSTSVLGPDVTKVLDTRGFNVVARY